MNKKYLFLMFAAVFTATATGAFAIPEFRASAGVGGYFTSDFGGGFTASGIGEKVNAKSPYAGGGGFAFLDLTFVEFTLGFFGGGGDMAFEEISGGIKISEKINWSLTGLDIGLLGKFPVIMSNQLTIFPFLGITYRAILSGKVEGESVDDPGESSSLWFRFGGGLDYSFNDNVFFRAGLLYGVRLSNKEERDLVKIFNDIPGVSASTRLGHGLELKLAIGRRF